MTGRGRPRIGEPVLIRLPDAMLAQVDELAEAEQVKRAEMIRRLIERSLRRS